MKTYGRGFSAALVCIGLGSLLAGFTPNPTPSALPEWRGQVSDTLYTRLPLSDPEVDAAPSSLPRHRFYITRVEARIETKPQQSAETSFLSFDDEHVSILTVNGPRALVRSGNVVEPLVASAENRHQSPSPLLAERPEFTSIMDVPHAILRRSDLRQFMTQGPLCVVPSFQPPVKAAPLPSLPLRVTHYQGVVEKYAKKYGLEIPLVLAIIQTESSFNPNLISSRNAHGLMQVVPATAGGEVHRWLGRSGLPTSSELLNPDTNILYGMSYLHLLKSRHLQGIRDPQSMEYCLIASYNGGSGAVLRHFAPNREDAVAVINSMTPQDVLLRLTEQFPARETRSFVRKVLDYRRQYVVLASRDSRS